MTQQRKKNKGKGKNPTIINGPSASKSSKTAGLLMYNGGVMIPRSKMQETITPFNMFFETQLTSSSVGTIATVYTNDPTNCLEWSTISGPFEEFRVLAFELEFFPSNRYSKTTTVCMPGVGVIDHAGTGALASLAAGFAHESCRVLSLEDPWTSRRDFAGNKSPPLIWNMMGAEEAVWTGTQSTLSNSAIKLYFTGLSNSTVYGMVLLRFLVQFTGRD